MAKLTFFSVLKSNLKCAFCGEKDCTVRYMPERIRVFRMYGDKFVIECEKDKEAREKAMRKLIDSWRLP